MPKPTLKIEEVAEALSISLHSFRLSRPRLEAAGFPRQLPILRSAVWSRAQVMAWIAANGAPADASAVGVRDATVCYIDAARDELAHRYGGRP